MYVGVNGFLLKDVDVDKFESVINIVFNGGMLVEFVFLNQLSYDQLSIFVDFDIELLSGCELDILKLIVGGYLNKEIVEMVFLVEGIVKNYVLNILLKLNI